MEPRIRSYRDLIVWQRAMDLIVDITALARSLAYADRLVHESQIRKAAVSVASALAEGSGRFHTRELRQYTYIARGSLWEVETQLIAIGRTIPVTVPRARACLEQSDQIGRMLTRMGHTLRQKEPRQGDLGSSRH
jgi:four helix bundle protein